MPAGPRLAPVCWAVDGSRSANGLPLVATALQWVPEQPSPWYLADLRARDLHVAGASLPGVPGVLVGHTEEVAWSLTPSLVDDQDLFVLTVDGPRARELVDGRWRPMRTVTERISIRGDDSPVLLKVRLSERGPIVRDGAREVLAMSFTGSYGPSPVAAMLAMARARSVSAAAAAWDGVVGPPLHLVAADISGRVLHQMVGLVPDRGFGAGRVPSSGQDSRSAWQGFLPRTVNPRRVDPAEGYVVVAGHDQWAEGDPASSTSIPGEYDTPWRARRVRGQLEARRDWDPASTLELLSDRVSLQARTALTILRPELERAGGRTARSLLTWDGSVEAAREEAHLYHRLMSELGAAVGGDEALRAGLTRSPFGPEEVLRLLAGGMDEEWWNDRRTATVEGSREILRGALARVDEQGLVDRWGSVHEVELEHPLARMAVVGPVFGRLWSRGPFPVGGDESTVAAFPSSVRQPFRVSSIPSLRVVMPVGRWDETVVAAPPGQSGQPWSTRSTDQLAPWLRGAGVTLPFSDQVVEAETHARVSLRP
jgi:penicillin amidase